MANYSNIEYDPNFFRGEDEDLFGYMQRLEGLRDGGVLGTGTGVSPVDPVTQEVTDEPLGEATYSCPVGYSWDGTKCVPDGSGDSGETTQRKTQQEIYEGQRALLENPNLRMFAQAVVPAGGLLLNEFQLEEAVRNTQNEATKQQGFLDYALGRSGDVVLGDKGEGRGSLVTGTPSVVEKLFGGQFNVNNFTEDTSVRSSWNTPTTPVLDPLRAAENQARINTLSLLNQPTYQDSGSGYYREPSTGMLYVGGQDYGGWTAVNDTYDGNDWESFGGDVATDTTSSWSPTVQDAIDYGY